MTDSCTRLLSIYHTSEFHACTVLWRSLTLRFFHQGFDILSLGKGRHGGSTKLNYWVTAETKHIKQGKTKSTNNWIQRHWQPVGATSSCPRGFCPAGTRACSWLTAARNDNEPWNSLATNKGSLRLSEFQLMNWTLDSNALTMLASRNKRLWRHRPKKAEAFWEREKQDSRSHVHAEIPQHLKPQFFALISQLGKNNK